MSKLIRREPLALAQSWELWSFAKVKGKCHAESILFVIQHGA
jgi:hypothetical protein